jgi:isoleucyl-tRNA synthetase
LIYYARSSWFIKTTAFKDKMIDANKKAAWYPQEIGQGRFGEWLENNIDWALSRERYWGTPLPVWICDNCGKQHCIGSIEDLKSRALNFKEVETSPNGLDLHRPYIDRVQLKCEDCGGTMNRVTEVIDAWFDSGSMPYGQAHYPFEHKDDFEEKYFPAEFIAEGLDQTRGWFYSMLAISVFISGKSSYKSCIVNNLVLDAEGRKMSKRLGNVLDPKKLIVEYGADAVRWYLMSSSQVWLPKRFDNEALVEIIRRFFSTLQNTYSFYSLYANIDSFKPSESDPEVARRAQIDRWVISRLHTLIEEVDKALAENDITRASRSIADFTVDDLSNWYVRRSRRRFWGSEDVSDKMAAYRTLFDCLLTVAKLMAPIAPFLSEDIYRRMTENLDGYPLSVHLCDFPAVVGSYQDKAIEASMDIARRAVELGRAARKDSKVKVRQPLGRLLALGINDAEREMLAGMDDIVLDEINVKRLDFDRNEELYFSMKAEPDFRVIGPKFGGRANEIAGRIKKLDRAQISKLLGDGKLTLTDGDQPATVATDDLKVKIVSMPGFSVASDGRLKVVLDLSLNDELIAEGNARELVNKIQNLRKSAGLDVTDRIKLGISVNAETEKALAKFSEYVKSETLAERLEKDCNFPNTQEFDLYGSKTVIALERI